MQGMRRACTSNAAMQSDEFVRLINARKDRGDEEAFHTFLKPINKDGKASRLSLLPRNNQIRTQVDASNVERNVQVLEEEVALETTLDISEEISTKPDEQGFQGLIMTVLMIQRSIGCLIHKFRLNMMSRNIVGVFKGYIGKGALISSKHESMIINKYPLVKTGHSSYSTGTIVSAGKIWAHKLQNKYHWQIMAKSARKPQLSLKYDSSAIKFAINDFKKSIENCETVREYLNMYNDRMETIIIKMPMLFIENIGDTYNVSHSPVRNTRCKFKTSMEVYFYQEETS